MGKADTRPAYGGRGSEEALPEGWEEVRAGEVLRLFNGFPFKPSDWDTVGLPIIRIQNLNNPNAPFNHYPGQLASRFRVEGGDLLFAWSGTPGTSFGAHIWAGGSAWLNQHIFRVEFDEARIDKRFLRFAINRNLEGYIAEAHGGVGLAHITKGRFEDGLLVLPPLPEQRRIVAKVEALLARVNAAHDRLARVPAILKRFRQSVLAAACSGRLSEGGAPACRTDDWGKDLPEGWRHSLLGSLLLGIEAGKNFRCEEHPPRADEQGVVKISAVTWGEFDEDESKTPPVGSDLAETTRIEPGDFLISRANTIDLVGSCVIVRQISRRLHLSDKVLRLQFADDMVKEWALLFLRSPVGRRLIEARATGNQASMRNITQPQLRAIPVSLPPPDQLVAIVRHVEALFANAGTIEQRAATALGCADRLTQAILSKAFRGELVSVTATVEGTEPDPWGVCDNG